MARRSAEEVKPHSERAKLQNRLRRVEGQVGGIIRMLEEDRACLDILTQVQAVRAALSRVEAELVRTHVERCVTQAFTAAEEQQRRAHAAELIEILQRAQT